jgi:upstream activation factor subunit UAF30
MSQHAMRAALSTHMTVKKHKYDSYDANPKNRNLQIVYELSESLQAVLKARYMTRQDVCKALWAYIKQNNLQDENNGKKVHCDALLKKLFNYDKVTMLKINKYLSRHLKLVEKTKIEPFYYAENL